MLDDTEIWNTILAFYLIIYGESLEEGEYDEEYKHELIQGYKICKTKTYYFANLREEEFYFLNQSVSKEEELYYYVILMNLPKHFFTPSNDDTNNCCFTF